MDIVLRVKRSRDSLPLDIIAINKKPKNIEDYFNSLSLHPPLLLRRIKDRVALDSINADSLLSSVKQQSSEEHANRRKQSRLKLAQQFRNKIIDSSEIIFYNGEPLKVYGLNDENCVIDEYEACEDEQADPQGFLEVIESPVNSDDENQDSEDSNREDHPYNDYPDEESSEESYEKSYEKSEEYEDYEVE